MVDSRTAPAGDGRTGPSVIIIGAGPTGLTLACVLARAGVSFRLIDSALGPRPGSRGKGLQPRSLEVLEDLAVVDRVLANGRMAMPMRVIAPDGRATMGGAVPEDMVDRPDIPYAASVITPEWRVEEALRDRLGEWGGAVEFGTTLAVLTQGQDSVSAIVRRGEQTEMITAQWLVGCDGGHSVTREQIGVPFVGQTFDDVRMIVADVEVDGADSDVWQMWQHADGLMALCPLPSTDLFQFQAVVAPGQDADLALANLQSILDRRSNDADIRLHDPSWASLWRANIRIVDRYRRGRVILAGDAAHIHSPAGGQGMNTGIQDAFNLGWKLAAVDAGACASLLDTYEGERRPVALGVLAMSNARLAQTIEQRALPIRRDTDTTQLKVNYRGSTLAHDDRDDTATVRSGDRAPDAPGIATLDGEHRLFDLTSGGVFTLLRFGPNGQHASLPADLRVLDVVERPVASGQIADTGGHLARAYEATDRTLVLIRPDGYVALICDTADLTAVSRYLDRTELRPAASV